MNFHAGGVPYHAARLRANAFRCGRIGLIAFLVILSTCVPVYSQRAKPEKGESTFRVPVNVVIVNATVSDKDDNPVSDLTADDFKIYEDGKPQSIQTFALELYEQSMAKRGGVPTPGLPERAAAASNGSRPRMISIFIDDVTAESAGHHQKIVEAIRKYLLESSGPEDRVAILAGSGRVQFPFSNDRRKLLEELEILSKKLYFASSRRSDCPALTDLQARKIAERSVDDSVAEGNQPPLLKIMQLKDKDFKVAVLESMACMSMAVRGDNRFEAGDQNKAAEAQIEAAKHFARAAAAIQNEEAAYRSGILLRTIRQHLRTLKHFDAVKTAILFSSGFLSEAASQAGYQLQEVIDQALSSGVVLNSIDVRGLYTNTMPASERASYSMMDTIQDKQDLYRENTAAEEESLFRIANDTGGLFYHNSNDMYDGLQTISRRQSACYVLTYAMPSRKPDGQFHKIKLEVVRPGLNVSYRKGYYAPREELTLERRKKEDILDALKAPGTMNEIPVHVSYNYYQADGSSYMLALLASVNIRGLHFIDENSTRRNSLDIVVAVFDEADRFVDGIEKSIDFNLSESNYGDIFQRGLDSKVEFRFPPGRYTIRTIVREGAEGKMGSAANTVEIP